MKSACGNFIAEARKSKANSPCPPTKLMVAYGINGFSHNKATAVRVWVSTRSAGQPQPKSYTEISSQYGDPRPILLTYRYISDTAMERTTKLQMYAGPKLRTFCSSGQTTKHFTRPRYMLLLVKNQNECA